MASNCTPTKPTIFVVPGAWHPSSAYSLFQAEMQKLGYPTYCDTLPGLLDIKPSTREDNATSSCAKDAAFLRQRLILLLDRGHGVVLVAHSYGLVPGSAMAHGLSKAERGSDTGVLGIISVGGAAVPERKMMTESYMASIDTSNPPDQYYSFDDPLPGLESLSNTDPMVNGASEPMRSAIKETLLPQAVACMTSPAPAQAWSQPDFAGKLVWVISREDKAMTPQQQRNQIRATRVKWDVQEMDGSHGVFVSRPKQLAEMMMPFIEEFRKL